MNFEKYVAIDWSGAKHPHETKKIQVAEYDPQNGTVSLACPPSKAKWSRTEVFEYVRCMVKTKRVLIGLDFAFAYPHCDEGGYFPNEPKSPPDVEQLWGKVEDICGSVDNLYGGPFYRDSPFKDYHRYPGFKGAKYEERYRVTDVMAKKSEGLSPCSVFKCIGPNQVGPGSVAGMRLLRKVRKETKASVWPFDTTPVPTCSTVVEIYPRLFLHYAEISREGNQPTTDTKRKLFDCYNAILRDVSVEWTADERDALISAAGMSWFACQEFTWQAPAEAAKYEGWIFGVKGH